MLFLGRFTDKTIVYSFFIIIFAVRENKLFCLSLNKIIMEQIKQKAYVKDSLTRAIREMKVAKIEGRKLQSVDDFINEMRGV